MFIPLWATLEVLPRSVSLTLMRVQGCGVGSSSERTRTAITAALKKKLKDIMGEFSALRQKLQLEYRRVSEIIELFAPEPCSSRGSKVYDSSAPELVAPAH